MESEAYADLHIHTTASDGTMRPEEIVTLAKESGLKAIAITDHDSISGIRQAIETATKEGCEVVPGVELSVTVDGIDLHMLGYYVDWTSEPLLERLDYFQRVRKERAEKMVQKLNALGIDIEFEMVQEIAGTGAIGRPHIAEALVQKQVVGSTNQAFHRFIGYTGPAYVPKFKISPFEGIDMIHSAGGVAVFAHPGTVRRDELIPRFVAQGLEGLEVIHPDHNETTTQHYINLAQKHGLVMTGGSDFHGPGITMNILGEYKIPYSWIDRLQALRKG